MCFISLWDLSVAMETTILIQSAPKPNAINPPTQLWFTLNLIKIGLLNVRQLGPKTTRTQNFWDDSDPNLFGPKTNRSQTFSDSRRIGPMLTDDIRTHDIPRGREVRGYIILIANKTHKTSEQSLLRNCMYNGTTNFNTKE